MPSPRAIARQGQIRAGRRVHRAFDTVSIRMIAVILLSSMPLAVLGGLVSWHNYQEASGSSSARAVSVVSLLRSQAQQDLSEAGTFLHELGHLEEVADAGACAKALHLALTIQQPRYAALGVLDHDGHVVCTAGDPAPVAGAGESAFDLGADLRITGVMAATPQAGSPGPRAMIVALAASSPAQAGSRTVVARLRLGWSRAELFGGGSRVGMLGTSRPGADIPVHAWLLGPDGLAAPACIDCGWNVPENLAALRADAAQGLSGGETGESLASGALAGPLGILASSRPTSEEIRALRVFIIRVIGIVLLLGFGLVAVAVGANMLVVSPLQRLTAAVTNWRRDGGYDLGDTRLMPLELRELSRAFTLATHSLARHETTLREAEARQELLIKEIHHRVKNNLQIIASLLNLQANRIRQPEARAEFASARDRVRALATLHRYLYSEGDLQTLNMRSFLQELCSQLFQAIGEKQGRRIQLHIDAPEIEMATDQAVPLSLIVTEAVSNAVKYAFPGGRSGHVHVSLSEIGDGSARLVLQDDGVGIPAGRAETETGIRDGLGIQLIRGFSRQLGAQLEIHEGSGTRYSLTFPLHPKEADHSDPAEEEAPAQTEPAPEAAISEAAPGGTSPDGGRA